MRNLLSSKPALFTLFLAAGLGAASLVSHGSPPDAAAAAEAGLGHRVKAAAYSIESNGMTLGIDASQASWRVGGDEKYLPVAVLLANSSKTGLWLNDDSFTYRAGETGVWQNLPTYKEVMGKVIQSSATRRLLGETNPFALRFSAMRRTLYSPFPSNDPDIRRGQSRVRVETAWVTGQSYAYAIVYLPNPGPDNVSATRYLRYSYPKEKVEITLGFRMKEP
jgi:hypothetical protein